LVLYNNKTKINFRKIKCNEIKLIDPHGIVDIDKIRCKKLLISQSSKIIMKKFRKIELQIYNCKNVKSKFIIKVNKFMKKIYPDEDYILTQNVLSRSVLSS
jgi:hypothetical protein